MVTSQAGPKILIVGAGPSGLVALKEMCEAGLDARIVEKASGVGGVYRTDAVYQNMYLTISNRFIAFSDFPDINPLCYQSSKEYVDYLERYVSRFDLWDRITFDSTVQEAKFIAEKRTWQIQLEENDGKKVLSCDRLIVATGSNQTPKYAPVPGFTGTVIHSSDYTHSEPYRGKNVLIIGAGESASDIASEVAKVAASTTNWSRRPTLFAPRFLNQKSNDEIDAITAYVHTNQAGKALEVWEVLEACTISRLSQIMSPRQYSASRISLWEGGEKENSKDALHFLCRINLNACKNLPNGMERSDQVKVATKSNRMPNAVVDGKLDYIVAKSASYNQNRVLFSDVILHNFDTDGCEDHEIEADVIIMCTGYETHLGWLDDNLEIDWNPRTWFKHCIPPKYEDCLAFLGWTRPHQGGIPCCSEILSRYLTLLYTGQRTLPARWEEQTKVEAAVSDAYWSESPHYKTLVDYPSFMHSVATLIGCVPCPPPIWKYKRFIQYYTFPFWPVFFRSKGPGAKPEIIASVLDQYETFEACGPSGHPILGYTLKRGILSGLLPMNPLYYFGSLFSSSDSNTGVSNGKGWWYWGKSKLYVGLHGVNIGGREIMYGFLGWFGLN